MGVAYIPNHSQFSSVRCYNTASVLIILQNAKYELRERARIHSRGRSLSCISADQCTTWLDEEKNVVEWFGKWET